jgi:hypothetical protein
MFNKKEKQKWVDIINSILDSKKNKITKKDREKLIALRERMRFAKTKKNWLQILKDLAQIAGAASVFFKGDL